MIFATSSDVMGYHLDAVEELITEDDKTEILAQVTRYTAGTVKGRVWFDKTESNEGFNMSAANVASNKDPKTIIAGLISWPVSAMGGSSLIRG